MFYFKRLKDGFLRGLGILNSAYDDIDSIDDSFYDLLSEFQKNLSVIENLMKDINNSVGLYMRVFQDITDNKISSGQLLSKDEYKLRDLGLALKKCTLYFGDINCSSKALVDRSSSRDYSSDKDFIHSLIFEQKNLVSLLEDIKGKLSGLSAKNENAVVLIRMNYKDYAQSIRTAGLLLENFLEKYNALLYVEEELKQKALALYQNIVSQTKILSYREGDSSKKMFYSTGIPKRDLVYLKYLMVLADQKDYAYLNIYPRSRITMHMDSEPFKHYNFVIGKKNSERNIHVVPLEYQNEFEEFVKKSAA